MSRCLRIVRYLFRMFPPVLVPLGFLSFVSTYFALQALAGRRELLFEWAGMAGALTTVLWMLFVRFLDDLADATSDIRLGRAGDPRYRDRPIVTGEVTIGDIRIMALTTAGLILALNLSAGSALMFHGAAVGLGITWLGFKWFFIPVLARNPTPLMFLGRKSLSVLMGIYAILVFMKNGRLDDVGGWMWPLCLAPAAEVAAWETARKIRLPEDETAYDTYSKVLGWRRAALLPPFFLFIAVLCLVPAALTIGLGWSFPAILVLALVLVIGASLRFRLRPTRAGANLRPYVEVFGAVAHAGMAVALSLAYGWGRP